MKAVASNIHIQHVLNGKAVSLHEWVSADKCSCLVGFEVLTAMNIKTRLLGFDAQ
jgi:hypothetical protein